MVATDVHYTYSDVLVLLVQSIVTAAGYAGSSVAAIETDMLWSESPLVFVATYANLYFLPAVSPVT